MLKQLAITLFTMTLLIASHASQAERLKDLASIAGVRDNQLVGYGLVVGLNGSGDGLSNSPFTLQSIKSMLTQFGVQVPAGSLKTKNTAAVILHATLPAFIKPGQKIDVTASSLGNAKDLRGGTLLMSPLKGADGKVYAIAQGDLIVSGLSAPGADGSKITVNHPSVGRIPNGAMIERALPNPFADGNTLVLNLHRADFTTATRVVDAVNDTFGLGSAKAIDAVSIQVNAPTNSTQKVAFASMLENIQVKPDDAPARIIINSRTGTVVISRMVRVTPVAVTHGKMTVTVTESPQVSQPNALASGTTQVTQSSNVEVTEEENRMFVFDPGITLNDIVRAVNQVGASPSDLVAILEALKSAGALQADLIVI